MANTKQQRKRVKVAQRQRLENLHYKSAIKTYFRSLKTSVAQHDAKGAGTQATKLASLIDKAAAKNAIHKNNAARKKSKVSRLLAQL